MPLLRVAAVVGPYYLAVPKVDERPELGIHPQDDVAAAAAVSAVRTALGDVFCPVKVGASGSAVPACAENAHVVYEVRFCHNAAKVVILFDFQKYSYVRV